MFLPCRPCCAAADPCEFCRPAGETGDIASITVTLSASDYECSWSGIEYRENISVFPREFSQVYRTSTYLFPGSEYSGTFSLSPVTISGENAWQYDFSCGGFIRFYHERTSLGCNWLFAPRSRFAYAQSDSSPPAAPSADCSSTLVGMPSSSYFLTECGEQNRSVWNFAKNPIVYYEGSFCEQGSFLENSTTLVESLERVADCAFGSTCLFDDPFGIDTVLRVSNPTATTGRTDIAGVAGWEDTFGTCAECLPASFVDSGDTIKVNFLDVDKASISESGGGPVYLTDVEFTYA